MSCHSTCNQGVSMGCLKCTFFQIGDLVTVIGGDMGRIGDIGKIIDHPAGITGAGLHVKVTVRNGIKIFKPFIVLWKNPYNIRRLYNPNDSKYWLINK